jgi:hypothetical protein
VWRRSFGHEGVDAFRTKYGDHDVRREIRSAMLTSRWRCPTSHVPRRPKRRNPSEGTAESREHFVPTELLSERRNSGLFVDRYEFDA